MTTVCISLYLVGVLVAGRLIYRNYAKGKEENDNFRAAWIVIGSAASWFTVVMLYLYNNKQHCKDNASAKSTEGIDHIDINFDFNEYK